MAIRLSVPCIVLIISLTVSISEAKRIAPKKVTPVVRNGIEYRAPATQMGCVEAWDTKTKQLIWRKQIYVVKYTIGLERCVQDVYIKSLRFEDGSLIIANEIGYEYRLDSETLNVEVLKGKLVLERK